MIERAIAAEVPFAWVAPEGTRPHPLVGPGTPPHCRPARPTTHPARARHRLVALATRPPGRRTTLTPEARNATVMLGQQQLPRERDVRTDRDGIIYPGLD